MAVTFLQVEGQITGRPSGVKPIKFSYTTSNGVVDNVNLASGSNAYTFASGLKALVVIPSTTNTVGITLKGVTGDTGVPLNTAIPSIIAVPITATGIVLSAAASIADVEIVRL